MFWRITVKLVFAEKLLLCRAHDLLQHGEIDDCIDCFYMDGISTTLYTQVITPGP